MFRLSGLTLTLVGTAALALWGNANGIFIFAIGVALWLAGHWHYALRHHEYKSPLAHNVFCRWRRHDSIHCRSGRPERHVSQLGRDSARSGNSHGVAED